MVPPPLPPPLIPSEHRHSVSYSTSILVIAALLSFAIVAIAAIHLLLRHLSRSRSRSSPPIHHHHISSSIPMTSSSPPDPDTKAVVDSLPIVSFSTMAATASTLDCAVCLSPFEPRDRIRRLPSCRHAFHSRCVDTWLGSTLSCPLCRSSVLPPPPPPPPEAAAAEIGNESSSSRRTEEPHPPLGHSFEYVVDEEVEEVLSRIRRAEKSEPPPSPPGDAVASVAGDGGSRNWLREYVDQLALSASTRWSRRFDSGNGGGGSGGGGDNWDLERNVQLHLEEEDDGVFSSIYRWLVGV